MKKVIIVGAIGVAIWYFLLREKKVKAPVANATDPVNTGNPQDAIVLQMIKDITAAYPMYSTPTEYQESAGKLFAASQPDTVQCLVAPCPPGIAKVSKAVEDKAKNLIDMLNKMANNMMIKPDELFSLN